MARERLLDAKRAVGQGVSRALASDSLCRTDHHLAVAQGQAVSGRDPREVVAAHIRRLEALRRAAPGSWSAWPGMW